MTTRTNQLLINPRPSNATMSSLSVDCVIFGLDEGKLKVLLIQHDGGPRDGLWALPGDYVHKDLSISEMPHNVLERLTGLTDVYVDQLGTFGDLGRVFDRRVITIAYYALVASKKYFLEKGPGAKDVKWYPLDELPHLIYDHAEILEQAKLKLRDKLKKEPVGFELLPTKFTLTQLQKVYEVVMDVKLDTRNFRKKILKTKLVIGLDERDESVPYRAPQLYKFDYEVYQQLSKTGYYFEI